MSHTSATDNSTASRTPSGREPAWWTRLPLPLALTAAAFLGVKQAELLLHQFQQSGTRSYGVSALGGGWPPKPDEAKAAVDLWNGFGSATADEAAAFLLGYTAVDLVLIACLVWLLSALGRRVSRSYPSDMHRDLIHEWNERLVWAKGAGVFKRLRPLGYFALFDVAEDMLRLGTYASGGDQSFYVAAFMAEKAKFVALMIVLLALLAGVRDVRAERPEWGRLGRHRRLALGVLRGQLALVLVFSVLLLVDLTGQVGDLFRRWTDSFSAGGWGSASILLLSAALWLGARRTWAHKASGRLEIGSWQVAGALVIAALAALVLSRTTGSAVVWALPIVLLCLLVLDLLARLIQWREPEPAMEQAREATEAARGERDEPEQRALQGIGALLASLPVVVVGIVLVKAAVGPLVLAFASQVGEAAATYSLRPALGLLGLGLVTIGVGALGIPAAVRVLDERINRRLLLRVHMAVLAVLVVFVGFIVTRPLSVPASVGSVTVVAVAFALLSLVFAELQRFSEVRVPPLGLALLGFKRTPVFLLMAGWLAIASLFPATSGLHDIRHHDVEDYESSVTLTGQQEDPSPATPSLEVPLVDVWESWLAQNCVRSRTGPVPMVFVIAHGGGIRAAYWTGSVLTTLLGGGDAVVPAREDEPTCESATARSRIFAISSISGGSVGAAAYLAQDEPPDSWYQDALGSPDYAAVALARGLFVDLPRSLIGFDADDRAALLEQAWEEKVGGLEQDYFTHLRPGAHGTPGDEQWMPVTMLNSAQAETGCQVSISAVRITAPATSLEDAGDCRAVLHRYRTLRMDVPDDPQTEQDDATALRVPAASVTVDTVDIMGASKCQQSFATSTAALMSARWPYISPSGRLPCGPPWVNTIDGGYADPAGYAGFHALWDQVAPLIARHNASEESEGWVVPVLVVVDNHYQSLAKAAEPARTPQLLVPPLGAQRAGKTKGPGREQAAVSAVALSPPGVSIDCIIPAYDPDGAYTGEPQRGRVLLAPSTRPGLPAPLAWTLAGSSRQDLDAQRDELFAPGGPGASLSDLLHGDENAAISCTPTG